MKHENRRLKEDLDDMNAELEELAKLKRIVEKNLEEALTTIVQEREQKHALKKELDQRVKTDSLYALQSLVNFGLADGRRNHDTAEDSPVLKRIESEFSSGESSVTLNESPTSAVPEPRSVVGDLFSEIHVTEIRKLEKLLEDVEIQKSELQTVLDEVHDRLRSAELELTTRDATIDQLKTQLSNITATATPTADDSLLGQTDIIHRPAEADIEGNASEEIIRLRNSTTEQEDRIRRLEADLTVMSQLATESQDTLSSTQDSLVQVTDDIANLYHLVCEVNGETPNRLTLEHVRGKPRRTKSKPTEHDSLTSTITPSQGQGQSSTNLSDTVEPNSDQQQSVTATDREQSPEKEQTGGTEDPRGDPIACCKLVETINDQIKFLRRAVERSVELSRQRQNASGLSSEETADMTEQIIKLKAMLSAKREQVSSSLLLLFVPHTLLALLTKER